MSKEPGQSNKMEEFSFGQEQHYHLMIGEVEDYAILMLDRQGVIRNWNKGAEKIKGYKEQEIVGKHFRIFYTPEDREAGLPEQLIETAVREGKALHEGWRVRKDGTAFWGSIVITALHDPQGNVIGFSKVTRDLTERKQTEDKLQQYSHKLETQNRELQQFAYAAAHDMKEPLRKIQLYYSAIEEAGADNLSLEKQRAYMARSADAARRMQQLIDDLLTYTRMAGSAEPFEQVDLNKAVEEACAFHQDTIEHLGATVECGRLPPVRSVPVQLRQLFVNLLSNSFKYRDEARPVVISIKASRVRVPGMSDAYGSERFYKIDFQDNGIGFSPEEGQRIFNLFERLHGRDKFPGTGIGLTICRRIMENNRGFIRATGIPGKGAAFELYFREK
jgi:PAS domain S-box-containing protein